MFHIPFLNLAVSGVLEGDDKSHICTPEEDANDGQHDKTYYGKGKHSYKAFTMTGFGCKPDEGIDGSQGRIFPPFLLAVSCPKVLDTFRYWGSLPTWKLQNCFSLQSTAFSMAIGLKGPRLYTFFSA
jgi:hypothetical protein